MQHQREIQWGAGNLDLEQKLEKGWTDEGLWGPQIYTYSWNQCARKTPLLHNGSFISFEKNKQKYVNPKYLPAWGLVSSWLRDWEAHIALQQKKRSTGFWFPGGASGRLCGALGNQFSTQKTFTKKDIFSLTHLFTRDNLSLQAATPNSCPARVHIQGDPCSAPSPPRSGPSCF